ncbi:MAG TPA: hypothetical protein VH333_21915 [Pseudonocardiaceae bacterium]|nr:hypothetical protein [Pseudonocardiaceae bacterium]
MTEPARSPSPALSAAATMLLCVAGGLAVGGSFGMLEEESEQAGNQTLTLSYTSWHLTQGGNYPGKIYFHAPHFGYPLVATGVIAVIGGLLLVLGRGSLARLAAPIAAVGAGMLVGTVWTMGMVVSADLDAVDKTAGFQLTWTSGIGFWLVLGAGVAAAGGGILALLTMRPRAVRMAVAEPDHEPVPPEDEPAVEGQAVARPLPSPHPREPEST